jgi:2-dehydro-3-deoxyphosphooctonate aldolase (KDO 8-P synthase)
LPVKAKAACAVSVSAIFLAPPQDPEKAWSDGPIMVPVDALADLIAIARRYDDLAKSL